MHELKKICEIYLVGNSSRVSLPLFLIMACSQGVFKTSKCTNTFNEAIEKSSINISRRYSSDEKDVRESFNEQRRIETILPKRIFRPQIRYPHHEFGTNRGKDGKGNFEMLESPFSPSNHCFIINKIDRYDAFNCPSSSPGLYTAKVFTTATNTITKLGLFILGRDSIKQSVKTRTSLVPGKFKVKQWKITKAKVI